MIGVKCKRLARRLEGPPGRQQRPARPDAPQRELTGATINQRVGIVDRACASPFPAPLVRWSPTSAVNQTRTPRRRL
jgi:hypothetical protein